MHPTSEAGVDPGGVAGVLLTGGASRRMGRDKAQLQLDGTSYARRLGEVLTRLAPVALEVGPGRSGLVHIAEEPPGRGPLAALVTGVLHLRALGWAGHVLALACDLPFLDASTLAVVARWPTDGSVVPLIGGRAQPLAARWSARDMAFARDAVDAGERAMKALLGRPGIWFLDESAWPPGLAERAFADVDTPGDLARLGLAGR